MIFKIAGTRVLVRTVLAYLASGKSVDWILSEWPQLSQEAVKEAMRLATESFQNKLLRLQYFDAKLYLPGDILV